MVKNKEKFDAAVNLVIQKDYDKVKKDKWSLKYHLMPKVGWLNDPNGLCYFNGEYHVFYQYSPLDAEGGLKFWGHYKSKDLIKWDDLGIAIYPDKDFDRDGVYSGSALVEGDYLYIFYTGNVKEDGDHDYIFTGRQQNVILTKTKDGVNFEEKKVILTNKDFPKEFTLHVRDPKVWKEYDNYYMVLGARGNDNRGYVIIYKSTDLENWSFHSIPAGAKENMGYMWECPDIFTIDNKDVLLISPQGIENKGNLYNNIYQSGYMVGQFTSSKDSFQYDKFIELDRGFDFYAPQTFVDNKGRRILIGWMGLPDIKEYSNPTVEYGWQHCLTIPRQLELVDNKLIQKPLEEMKSLRKQSLTRNLNVNGEIVLDKFGGQVFELYLEIKNIKNDFSLKLRNDCFLKYFSNLKIFELCLGKSGVGRRERRVYLDNLKDIHIFSDTSSIEIFLNGGEEVFTTRFYQEQDNDNITICCEGQVKMTRWNI